METPDQPQVNEEPSQPATSKYGPQGANGFDLTLFRANLRLTPEERIERLQQAVLFFEEVRRAGRNARLSRDDSTPR